MAQYPKPLYETRRVIVGWRHKCLRCGEVFESKRRDARYCSGKCREAVRAARERGEK
jgi:predicted nucleic acid-binding Zn ribbon protein